MAKTIQTLLRTVSVPLLMQGKEYHKKGCIDKMIGLQSGNVEAVVCCPDRYYVEVWLDEEGNVLEYDCDCSEGFGIICEHIAAVLYALQQDRREKEQEPAAAAALEEELFPAQKPATAKKPASPAVAEFKPLTEEMLKAAAAQAEKRPAKKEAKSLKAGAEAGLQRSKLPAKKEAKPLKAVTEADLTLITAGTGSQLAVKEKRPDVELSLNPLNGLLKNALRSTLEGLLQEACGTDPELRARVMAILQQTEPADTFELGKEAVEDAVRENTHRGAVSRKGCDLICAVMNDTLESAKDCYVDGQERMAFELTLFLLHTGVKLAGTAEGSGAVLADTMGAVIVFLEKICMAMGEGRRETEKQFMYERLCKEAVHRIYESWLDWSYRLLYIAGGLMHPKNTSRLQRALEIVSDQSEEKNGGRFAEDRKRVQLVLVENQEGEAAARAFAAQNLDLDYFRREAVRLDIRAKNFRSAEKLCLASSRKEADTPYGKPSQWLYCLFDLYTKWSDREGQRRTALQLLLGGDLKYFSIIKHFMTEEGIWKEASPKFLNMLCEEMPFADSVQFVEQEQEHGVLLGQVETHPEKIDTYGPMLAKKYPTRAYSVYTNVILDQTDMAESREEYREICKMLAQMVDLGGKSQAKMLVRELQRRCKKRLDMLEELEFATRGW